MMRGTSKRSEAKIPRRTYLLVPISVFACISSESWLSISYAFLTKNNNGDLVVGN